MFACNSSYADSFGGSVYLHLGNLYKWCMVFTEALCFCSYTSCLWKKGCSSKESKPKVLYFQGFVFLHCQVWCGREEPMEELWWFGFFFFILFWFLAIWAVLFPLNGPWWMMESLCPCPNNFCSKARVNTTAAIHIKQNIWEI